MTRPLEDPDLVAVEDDDGGTDDPDLAPCERCGCPNYLHEVQPDGDAPCGGCGTCKNFKPM